MIYRQMFLRMQEGREFQCETKVLTIGSMTDIEAVKQTMVMNCIPEDVATMGIEDYEERFLSKRRELMAEKIRRYYEAL